MVGHGLFAPELVDDIFIARGSEVEHRTIAHGLTPVAFITVTTQIAQFMVQLEELWDQHLDATLVRRDLEGALRDLVDEPSVQHLPGMTGAVGRAAVERFFAVELLPHLPDDLTRDRVTRTVDRFRLVDETTVSFTHDRELPWLLPGVAPTDRRAEVLTVTIVSFQRGRISAQRTLWDHATLAGQLELPGLMAGPREPVS